MTSEFTVLLCGEGKRKYRSSRKRGRWRRRKWWGGDGTAGKECKKEKITAHVRKKSRKRRMKIRRQTKNEKGQEEFSSHSLFTAEVA